jgi:hypothetical protein
MVSLQCRRSGWIRKISSVDRHDPILVLEDGWNLPVIIWMAEDVPIRWRFAHLVIELARAAI